MTDLPHNYRTRQRRLPALALFVAAAASAAFYVQTLQAEPRNDAKNSNDKAAAPEKSKRFPGYAKQKKDFKELCAGIEQDGHAELIYTLMNDNLSSPEEDCVACVPLFKALAGACKPKTRKKSPKKTQKEPPPIVKQPETSDRTAKAASQLFATIASNAALFKPSLPAVQRLSAVLTDPQGKVGVDKGYCAGLAQQASAPFVLYREIQKRGKAFRKLCKNIYEDGQAEAFYQILSKHTQLDFSCMACRPLIKTFADACGPAQTALYKEEAGGLNLELKAETSLSNEVMDSTSTLFSNIAIDPKLVDESANAVIKLVDILSQPSGKSAATAAYAHQLADEILAPFRLYVLFRLHTQDFTRLCIEMDHDGRREAFFKLISMNIAAAEPCPDCRALLSALAATCKPKAGGAPPQIAAAEPTPTAAPKKQREPHPQVVDAFSEVFAALAANQRNRAACIPAIQHLVQILRNPADKTHAELDYFSTLAEYVYAPFESENERRQNQKHKGELAEGSDGAARNLNELSD